MRFLFMFYFFLHKHPRRTVARTSERVRTSARACAHAERQFLDEMAVAKGSGEEGDKEEEKEEGQEQQGGFIVPDDEGEPGPSPSYYRRLEQEEVTPYFPSAFAVGPSSPLDFNFELFLLDSLSLPCTIEKREDSIAAVEAVNFETLARAIAYCTEKIEQGWRATLPPTSSQMLVTASRQLDKRTLFQRH